MRGIMSNLDQEPRVDLDELLVWTIFEDKVVVQVVVIQLIWLLDIRLKRMSLIVSLVLVGNGVPSLRLKLLFLWNSRLIEVRIITI
jgi:hypothetical protein